MAREAPLLLFLMSLGISGSQETRSLDENYLRKEGQMLNVSCSYPLKDHEKSWKVWCKLQENRKDCNKLVVITKFWVFTKEGKFSLQLIDESKSGHIIIIMSGLREKDSGHYWCMTIKKNNAIILKRIHLVVSPAQNTTKEIWTTSGVPSNTPATCSLIEHLSSPCEEKRARKPKFLRKGEIPHFGCGPDLPAPIRGPYYRNCVHQETPPESQERASPRRWTMKKVLGTSIMPQ
ncbi:natural cytotoxicity triggering receptor 2-like isoform X2 [Vombatus ursinus]|uniref:natural cytotoxicity triggering receptor 2-like isoform X2 n=1 Tax=Vombatus ursinus TaxID=29139 RepID=UPI000FFD1FEF|nr:natural cytotoxicity triggering receptor 2-like isoform X2 [Vombatus ursinus]XP_027732349.1 natural cytotoxicity triggering receptor 2-like isoform X2 [Vombatus ursinus]